MPSLQLGIWQSAVRFLITYPVTSKLVSAFSNWKKILSKNISPFGTVKTESENIWICWRWQWHFIKSNRTKNTSRMLRYLLGLIYYSNTIFRNISGKNEIISLYCALKCNGAQGELFFILIFLCAHAGYLVIFTETGK